VALIFVIAPMPGNPSLNVSLTCGAAPLTAGVTSANRFGFSDAIGVSMSRWRAAPSGLSSRATNPMIYSAIFRDRRDGGTLEATRATI
jgi:hypothetical protein